MRLTVTALWTLNVIAAVIYIILYAYQFLNYKEIWHIYDSVLFFLDLFLLVSSVTTYVYFYLKVKSIEQAETKANCKTASKQTLLWKKFKIPILMVSTFILINIQAKILFTIIYIIIYSIIYDSQYKSKSLI